MIGIALTNRCQLNCKYCFSKDIRKIDKTEISIDDFKYLLDFLKSGNENFIKLAGGEPLLHSQFPKIMELLTNDDNIKSIEIFSNGIIIDKYIDKLTNPKISGILINCNSENDIGKSFYNKLKNNIALLSETNKNRLGIGINLYHKDMDYSFIFDLLKIAKLNSLRFSIAVSNDNKKNTSSVLESFKEFQPLLRQFFKDCLKNNIVPYYDCNAMPECILETEDKKLYAYNFYTK